MELRTITVSVILATAVTWIVWDCYVYFGLHKVEATFSRILFEWSQTPPGFLLVLAFGVLMGHFFVSVARLDLLGVLLAGIAAGAIFWGQKKSDVEKKDEEA